ncbi:tetratricopeptide repeat protein [Candidatus Poribacteria bacterium]|nr:tetratricopeptide repeat protein [Candidatus Poribacteria bacterium]
MKKYYFLILIFSLVHLFIFSSCGKKKEEEKEENVTITLKTEKREAEKKEKPIPSIVETKKFEKPRETQSIPAVSEFKEEIKKETQPKVKEKPAPEIMAQGQKLYQEGKFSQALDEFQNLLNIYPKDNLAPEAQYNIGTIYLENLKLYSRAKNAFNSLISNYPQYSKNDSAKFYAAKSLFMDRKYDEAIIEYRELLENYQNSKSLDKALWEMGNIYFQQMEEYEEAIKLFQQIVKQYPTSSYADKAYLAIGNIYMSNLFEEDEALKIYQNFSQQFPSSDLKLAAEKKKQEIVNKREKIKKDAMDKIEKEEKKRKLEEETRRRREEQAKLEEKRIQDEYNRKEAERKKQLEEEAARQRESEEARKLKEKQDVENNKTRMEINDVIQNHKKAMESRNIKLYANNWYSIPKNELSSAENFFTKFKKISINIREIEMKIENTSAIVFITQDMDMVDEDKKEMRTSNKMKWEFIKDNDIWKINKTEVLK